MFLYELSYAEVEAWIVDEDDNIRLPSYNVFLAHLHVFEDGWQVKKYWDKAHVS